MHRALLSLLLLFTVTAQAEDTIQTAKPQVISTWKGTVPLRSDQVLHVELELHSEGSAIWTEKTYKNWGHFHNKREPVSVIATEGTYDDITREELDGVTGAGGKPAILVTVVGLSIGDWKVNYGDRKGSSIMRFDKTYAATLFLREQVESP